MNATNTFQDGLLLDSHPLAVPNNVLTNCLNGTLITYNGNELILQNDVGNSKIIYKDAKNVEQEVKLTSGFVPVGMKSFNGIVFIFSHNEQTGEGEIGTFPSPDYNNGYEIIEGTNVYIVHDIQYVYRPLRNLVRYNDDATSLLQDNYELVDFRTKELNFDLQHPLTVDCQLSYDDSVNIIFNDGKNIPRLVNSGFAPYGDHKVKIIRRDQLLETNVYDEANFKYNTSLIRTCNSIVDIKFDGITEDGDLPVGNYVFYFKVADSDDNESDFIGQSGLVVCHKGKLNDPKSIDGGIVSENSKKSVKFTISKIPRQFSRLYVYYSRYSSTVEGTLVTEYKKIARYFDLTSVYNDNRYIGTRKASITINGNDTTLDVSLANLNPLNMNPLSANAQSVTNNRLFMANIHENVSLYSILKQYSELHVKVKPCKSENEDELIIDKYVDYESYIPGQHGYYDVKNIYNKVGYWPEEYYRFGIVYILDDYTLTPVFNIIGEYKLGQETFTNKYGVIKFPKQYFYKYQDKDPNVYHTIHFPKFTFDSKPPSGVIGCIFVRQKRIKNIIGQALFIGSDQDFNITLDNGKQERIISSHLPVLWGGSRYKWVTQSFVRQKYSRQNPDIAISGEEPYYRDPYHDYSVIHKVNNIIFPHHQGWVTEIDPDTQYEITETTPPYNPTDIYLGNSWITHQSGSWVDTFSVAKSIYRNAAIMPEFELKQQYYSGLFCGQEFTYERIVKFGNNNIHDQGINDWYGLQHLMIVDPAQINNSQLRKGYIIGVQEQTVVKTKNYIYSSISGSPSDPSLYSTPFTNRLMFIKQGQENKDAYERLGIDDTEYKNNFGVADYTYHTRGIFSPYLGIETVNGSAGVFDGYELITIKLNDYGDSFYRQNDLIEIRKQDYSEFYPISQRIDFREYFNNQEQSFKCFRGDCYIGNFTHRMLRNFIDPEFQIQDQYAQKYCWSLGNRLNYDEHDPDLQMRSNDTNFTSVNGNATVKNSTATAHLNRSDVNTVPLGQWVTFKYYSSINPCMRSSDASNSLEFSTFGQARKFYPLYNINLDNGQTNKLADSYIYNEGYEQSVGQRMFNLYPEVPSIRENFGNRIVYSELSVDSLVVNNLRQFEADNYRDYTRSYGNITKLLPWSENYLIVVFEHGLALVQINEKGVVSEIAKQAVYIDTTNVLGDLNMISEQYGSQWPESVIVTSTNLYGVDASAKKIWKFNTQFECISDLKVGKFLRENLNVSSISNQIDVLQFNIKTHYNAKKQDVMFTFYKNIQEGELLAWNLCYNEITKKITTFYSWIPLYSYNIDNTYYSIPFIPEMSSERLLKTLYPWKYTYDPTKWDLNIWEHTKKFNNWCNWYGEQHPFEFEYVVNANPNFQKIFHNIQMISNKAVPESFHFEIVGEGYDFSKDKKNMYYRQEATKSFYDWCMSRMLEENYDYIQYDKDGVNDIYLNNKLQQNQKSAIFPLFVEKLDYTNKIYDIYKQLTSPSKDYQSLSGSEITYDKGTNDYLIDTHIKAHPKGEFTWQTVCRIDDSNVDSIATYYVKRGIEIKIDETGEYLQKKVKYDQRLSNCYYNEDSWYIQVPVINYYEKNEDWNKTDNKPPINIVIDPLPKELSQHNELVYNKNYPIDTDNWVTKKQTPIRDKYIKIKIRYTGDDFVVISGIINIFKESYN